MIAGFAGSKFKNKTGEGRSWDVAVEVAGACRLGREPLESFGFSSGVDCRALDLGCRRSHGMKFVGCASRALIVTAFGIRKGSYYSILSLRISVLLISSLELSASGIAGADLASYRKLPTRNDHRRCHQTGESPRAIAAIDLQPPRANRRTGLACGLGASWGVAIKYLQPGGLPLL